MIFLFPRLDMLVFLEGNQNLGTYIPYTLSVWDFQGKKNDTDTFRSQRLCWGVVDRYMNSMLFALDDLAMAHEQLVTGLQQAGEGFLGGGF